MAKMSNLSTSQWVRRQIAHVVTTSWPNNYFDCFGSLAKAEGFVEPKELSFTNDVPRAEL